MSEQYPTNPNQHHYPTMGHDDGYGHSQYVAPWQQQARPPVDGLGLTGMVLGLSLLIFGWFPFVGIVIALVALPFSAIGLRRVRRGTRRVMGFSVTGLVMGIIGLLGCTLWTIAAVTAANDFEQYDRCTDNTPVLQWDKCDKYLD